MSDVNGPQIGVNQVKYTNLQKQEKPVEKPSTENLPQLTDFSDTKAEALGRSMLFKGIDDINNDLKVLVENPQIAENSDKVFETTYAVAKEAGIENPYEEAASASTTAL